MAKQLARHAGKRRLGRPSSRRAARSKTTFFLNIQIEIACDAHVSPVDWIGGDMGRTASCPHRTVAHGPAPCVGPAVTAAISALSPKAQGRRPCRVILKRLSGGQGRFLAAENHAIHKLFVRDAVEMRAGICLKGLTGMCGRTIVPKALAGTTRSFFQLRTFVASKATMAGIPVEIVQPHDTSQSCSRCGALVRARARTWLVEPAVIRPTPIGTRPIVWDASQRSSLSPSKRNDE